MVSVVIPTYNNARFLPEALDSLLAQTCRDFELIVVDDGSTDDTEEVLKPYRNLVRYVRKDNGGPASARNLGIRQARGQLIAFQDADDIWLPDKLQRQVDYLRDHPNIGVVFSDVTFFGAEGRETCCVKQRFSAEAGMTFDNLFHDHFVGMSTVVVRSSCLNEVGLFDESLIGAEDYNLYLRLAKRFQFGFLDEPLIKKRLHENNLSNDLDQMLHDEIANLHKIAALFPEDNVSTRSIAARIYFRFGKYHFDRKAFEKATSCLFRALRLSPLLWEAWTYLIVAILPAAFREQLLALMRKARKARRARADRRLIATESARH
jgi:glycosyltransferase involved in cell wall biosynthesis